MTPILRQLLSEYSHIGLHDIDMALFHDNIELITPANLTMLHSVLHERLIAAQLEVKNLTAAHNSL